ncbi:beta-ketoacyl-ACP synthase II [Hyphobacterium marinum]|uniref:3-oxoacyl-[acyl-carrier-protein] synthase 2 n=1 Tax=Hyphobacterium marinum TaxID=3116574 RepID=A0ABU7M044_9PROT|nr:beta-ketoacyl-ACP synthase II [Hyphobacterium sp. Y6023]MEE2567184.1 beta-ketoacyl-ACP synthase II [Hyphobacterium sp. Y6023]
MRRVVVTGLGLVTPLGCGVAPVWNRLIGGESGIRPIEHFETSDLAARIAGIVPRVDGRGGGSPDYEGAFDPDAVMSARERKRFDEFILYGIAAADDALADAGWSPQSEEDQTRTGVLIGSGTGGLETTYQASVLLHEQGPRKLSPFVIPGMIINMISGQVSIKHGLKGPNHAVVTACSTGAHAIGDAARLIKYGDADVMVAGGAEAAICRLGVASFVAARAMSTKFNDTPEKASRPYDRDRDGFVMGEGAGVVVLEEYEHARARGAKIYAEVAGYGLSGDAFHITAPAEDGDGGFRAMKAALASAGLTAADIDYVNAHGTSTPKGDEIELRAVERLFGDAAKDLVMSSTKSAIGHLLGAAGAVEAIFSILAIRNGVCPPTLNLDNPSCETVINLAPHTAVERPVRAALSNSFGFGGTNASVVFTQAT